MHPMVIEVVQAALQVCDRTEFFARGVCHSCGGALSGYDTRTKRFALVSDDNGDHPVEVILHRAYCRECGKIWMPEEPFYAGTRIGSPVVDLCQTLAMSLYSGHVAEVLDRMGVKVDRWSVRSYSNLPIAPPPTVAVFGMNIPLSIVALSSLNGDGGKDGPVTGADILDACNHPSQNRPYL
jgi:hypothetical protein